MKINKIVTVSVAILGLAGSTFLHAAEGGSGTTFTEGANTFTAAGDPAATPPTGANFVAEDFDFNVSANVSLTVVESAVLIGATAASSKGAYVFSGLSLGGAVDSCGAKAVTGVSPEMTAPVLANEGACTSNPART
jgi:hypothetical protein